MKTIASTEISSEAAVSSGYSGIYSGGEGDETISISDGRLSTEVAARARAYAELLNAGYKKIEITLDTPFDARIGINSVVVVTAPRKGVAGLFLVKEIDIKGDRLATMMTLKAVRYD